MKKSLSVKQLITACFLLFMLLGFNTTYGQGTNSATDCIPLQTSVPGGADYVGQFHGKYSDGTIVYDLTHPQHSGFISCNPLSPQGGTNVHSMGSTVQEQISINGQSPLPVKGQGQMTARVTSTGTNGSTRTFDTEMLQLDIDGGTLPPGVNKDLRNKI